MKCSLALLACAASLNLFGQWHNYPTPNLPRTSEGKPNMKAPAPRTPDGHPDLSGLWQFGGMGYAFNILGVPDPPKAQPWAEALFQERSANFGKDDTDVKCLPAGPRSGLFSVS